MKARMNAARRPPGWIVFLRGGGTLVATVTAASATAIAERPSILLEELHRLSSVEDETSLWEEMM